MNIERSREFKTRLCEHLADICKAFANPRRLEILDILAQGEHSVESVAREAGLSVANASQHLQHLRAARLVVVRRSGVHANYQIAGPAVFKAIKAVQHVAESHSPELRHLLDTYIPDRNIQEQLDLQELANRIQSPSTLILDVRPYCEYQNGHIPGAISLPLSELPERMSSLPLHQEIVTYCRGIYSPLADQAVEMLGAAGFNARRLAGGFPEWKYAGYPTQIPPANGSQTENR